MSENEFEGLPDNNWDDTWDFAWSEFDWERHLKTQDATLQTYLSHYEKAIERPDRIDEVAHQMGWDEGAWINDDPEPASDAVNAAESASLETPSDRSGDVDPYTLHKHPVFVSTHALFLWLQRSWEFVAPACGQRLPIRAAVSFSAALARAEHEGLMATHSLDMGDFSLAVCQVKRAMTGLNDSLRHLQSIDGGLHPALAQFVAQAAIRLFDIREIWLRVMRDCREELDRRVGEGEN